MKKIVVSGINMTDSGLLTVYYSCLDALIAQGYHRRYEIIALVAKKSLFRKYEGKIRLIEFPRSKKSWLARIYYEYFFFYQFSRGQDIELWLSLHDMTPRVAAHRQICYFHNATPLYRARFRDLFLDKKVVAFSFFYRYLYRIHAKGNEYIIVQQDHLRNYFSGMLKIPRNRFIVAYPNPEPTAVEHRMKAHGQTVFLYPSYPRVFKNFEVVCEAVKKIEATPFPSPFQVRLTLDGGENRYSRALVQKYGELSSLSFVGIQSRENLSRLYRDADYVIFPSKLESWGLPITEAKEYHKPLLVANLPYAAETVGTYDRVAYFDPDDSDRLAQMMVQAIRGTLRLQSVTGKAVEAPFAESWESLLAMILDGQ